MEKKLDNHSILEDNNAKENTIALQREGSMKDVEHQN